MSRPPIVWLVTRVRGKVEETAHAMTVALEAPDWPGHLAGQHVDVRLTAEDGYQAQRSYSIASAPEGRELALTVERIDDGEVSPYLTDELAVGDELELRGPIGGHFTWRVQDGGPLLLLAGGSGLVPLMAMLRHHAAHNSTVDARLLLSARTPGDVIYRDELTRLARRDAVQIDYTFTREASTGWKGFRGRVNAAMLATVAPSPEENPRIFVCGPTSFVEHAADLLVSLGHPAATVSTERFGSTGS